jgi:hypothetical protein
MATKVTAKLGFDKGAISPKPSKIWVPKNLIPPTTSAHIQKHCEIGPLIFDFCLALLLRLSGLLHPDCTLVWNHHPDNLALCGALV